MDIQKNVNAIPGNKDAALIADQSVLSFLQIIIKLNTDKLIISYRKDPDIVKDIHLKNYKVTMGFGLHYGWGIEGAIGSTHKIDCSYLSPNVNISARLEAATKQYGVNILISGELFDLCSEDIQNICRLIDVVSVKGSIKPIKLYTIDFTTVHLTKDKQSTLSLPTKERNEKLMKEKEYVHFKGQKFGNLVKYVLTTVHFKQLLNLNRDSRFVPTHKDAVQAYINGEWRKSRALFECCLEIDPNDGPSKTIYEFIKSNNFSCPSDWNGYRSLNSK